MTEEGNDMLKRLLYEFMDMVEIGEIEVYNEFSLQHELGIFLRNRLKDYKVQFERNTKFFGITGTIKHEIDIVVYNEKVKYAIELKYPVNGQYPEQMYSFIKDIIFMEELEGNGFDGTCCLTMVKDKNFYSGKKIDGIYSYFRGDAVLAGSVNKPTGKILESVSLKNEYKIEWQGKSEQLRYYIIDIMK